MTAEIVSTGIRDQGLAVAPAPEKKPMTTLASPVGGALLPERQIDWLTTMAATWNEMPDEIKDALILLQRSFPASGGGSYFLTPPQALMVVRYCREKGIGVHSDTWWFDPRNYRVGSTVSGLREEARSKGLDLGAPVLTPIKRPWPQGKAPIPNFTEDVGYHCTISVGTKGAPASCDVWLSSAYQPKSPMWQSNADHMLQVRAIGTCTKFAMGSGISAMPESIDDESSQK